MREQSAGADLVGGAEVIVFGFVAFQRRGKKLIDGDCAEAGAAQMAYLEDGEVEGVEDGDRDQEILGGFSEDSHGGGADARIS